MIGSCFVLTDSGGLQEETTFLNIPCLTIRENTERPITVEIGTNIIVGTNPDRIVEEAIDILNGNVKNGRIPPLWDGKASERIVDVLRRSLNDKVPQNFNHETALRDQVQRLFR